MFHKCCGKGWYDRSNVCTQIAKGMYHPGKLEVTILPGSRLHRGTTKSLQWSCCGTKVFTQSAIGRTPHSRAPGCTPLDLTLRVTTVTRPRGLAASRGATSTPSGAAISYSRRRIPGLGRPVRAAGCELACMFGTAAGRRRTRGDDLSRRLACRRPSHALYTKMCSVLSCVRKSTGSWSSTCGRRRSRTRRS